jgi:glycosyltransferase involved in cell wall biosynthesis
VNILLVTPYLALTYGGTSKSVRELATTIGNTGTNVDLVTTNANGKGKLNVPVNCWLSQETYRVRYFPCWNQEDFIFSPALLSWLVRNLHRYDLVHTNTIFAPAISLTHWLCRLQKIPYIATPHGMLEPWALSYKTSKKRLYYHLIEKPLLTQAKAIQTLAYSESKNLNALGYQQTIVIPNGIHRQDFETLPSPEDFYQQFPETRQKTLILFLGRIDPKKGLDLLAPAFAKVRDRFREAHLVVAGPDSIGFLPTVRNYFREAGCLEAVTFTGMLSGSLKYAAFAVASIYVAPSYSEGFSMSILEGMASGLPCIFTTSCNFSEAAAANAARVVDVNTNAIAEALIECLSQPVEAQAMGDRAREFIFQNYTWDKMASKLVKAYQEIAQKEEF